MPTSKPVALKLYDWRRRADDETSYWVTGARAAKVIGVNLSRLDALAVRGFLPFELHADGHRMYRRAQLEIVANAPHVRWHSAEV